MKILYFTFVYPNLLYGIEVYANTPSSHISMVQGKVQQTVENCSGLFNTNKDKHALQVKN